MRPLVLNLFTHSGKCAPQYVELSNFPVSWSIQNAPVEACPDVRIAARSFSETPNSFASERVPSTTSSPIVEACSFRGEAPSCPSPLAPTKGKSASSTDETWCVVVRVRSHHWLFAMLCPFEYAPVAIDECPGAVSVFA